MKNFKELFVWQKSTELIIMIYAVTKNFSAEEKYGLASQMRRAAVSIASNIAEGHLRRTNKDFGQFLSIARGSCAELETQSIIAERLMYFGKEEYIMLEKKIEEVAKMLSSLYGKVSR
ncbi:MAG TPA: four helix bundle protein [Candidatus Paceibacterota bacterium]|nr:four helix bundle protein [Candidatus Paceibacterota bacterium]